LLHLALSAEKPRHAHRRPQFPGFGLLLARNRERALKICFGFRVIGLGRQRKKFLSKFSIRLLSDGNGFVFTPIGIMSCASGPSLVCGRRP
jgi:hypothetical protein